MNRFPRVGRHTRDPQMASQSVRAGRGSAPSGWRCHTVPPREGRAVPPREGHTVPLCARTPAMSLAAVFREGLQGPVLPCVLCAGAGGGAELPLGEGPTLRGDRGWPLCHLLGGEGGGVQRPWWRFLRLARCWAMDEPSTPARLNVSPSVGDSKNPRTGSRRPPLHAGSVPGPTQQPGPRSQKCPLGWAPCGAVAAGGPMPGQG